MKKRKPDITFTVEVGRLVSKLGSAPDVRLIIRTAAGDYVLEGALALVGEPQSAALPECSCPRDNMYDSSRTGHDDLCYVHGTQL